MDEEEELDKLQNLNRYIAKSLFFGPFQILSIGHVPKMLFWCVLWNWIPVKTHKNIFVCFQRVDTQTVSHHKNDNS